MLFLINALKQWLNSPKSSDFGELQGFALRINRAAVYSVDIIIALFRAFFQSKTQKKISRLIFCFGSKSGSDTRAEFRSRSVSDPFRFAITFGAAQHRLWWITGAKSAPP